MIATAAARGHYEDEDEAEEGAHRVFDAAHTEMDGGRARSACDTTKVLVCAVVLFQYRER